MRAQSCHYKDAGADDRAYTQCRQRNRPQCTLQMFFPFFLSFRNNQA